MRCVGQGLVRGASQSGQVNNVKFDRLFASGGSTIIVLPFLLGAYRYVVTVAVHEDDGCGFGRDPIQRFNLFGDFEPMDIGGEGRPTSNTVFGELEERRRHADNDLSPQTSFLYIYQWLRNSAYSGIRFGLGVFGLRNFEFSRTLCTET